MKTSNPKSRFHIDIKRSYNVLEVGGGHNPHPRSNVVVDKFVDSNYHRHADIKVLKKQRFVEADGEKLPFEDNEFDFVICNQVLEHVENPHKFLTEQMRVAKQGYLETPSLIGEYLFPKKSHKWLILELNNKLVLMDKSKYWFDSDLDFGFLFLTWLNKTSLSYKLLSKSRPDLFTIRYEWKNEIAFEVNPDSEKVKKYFNSFWNEDMVREIFPERPMHVELGNHLKEFLSTMYSVVLNRIKKKAVHS